MINNIMEITMFTDQNKFVEYKDLRWSGILKSIKKSSNVLQPLFEAFTNSMEAIRLRQNKRDSFDTYINSKPPIQRKVA